MSCTYCHQTDGAYNAASSPLPNAHTKHVDEAADGGYNYACTNCHLNNGTNMAHQDGTVAGDILFTVTAPPWGNDGDEALGGTGTGFGEVRDRGGDGLLHLRRGLLPRGLTAAATRGTRRTGTTRTPCSARPTATGAAVPATARTRRRTRCRRTRTGAKGNKHPIHHTTEGYGCQVCHYATTTNGTSIPTPTPATHVNGAYTVDDDGVIPTLDSFTYTGGANGTCTVSECHGGVSVDWNRAATPDLTCDSCHATTGGVKTGVVDVPSYTRDGTTISKINDVPTTGEFVTVGHGLAANGGLTCAGCHDSAVAHDTTAGLSGGVNPFRLRDLDGVTAGLQFSCNYTAAGGGCHVGTTATDLAGITYSQLTTHSAPALIALAPTYDPKYDGAAGGWGFAPDCINCHDPHGDGANIAMIQGQMYDKAAFTVPTAAPPAYPTEQLNLVFTDNTTGVGNGSYAWTTTMAPNYSGICQECHEGTMPGTDTTYAYVDGVSASGGLAHDDERTARPATSTTARSSPRGATAATAGTTPAAAGRATTSGRRRGRRTRSVRASTWCTSRS